MDESNYNRDDLQKIGADWLERIAAADKRDKEWFDAAENAEKTYLCEEVADNQDFNILYSMVETTVPAIYNSTPSPDIRPRHNQPNPVLKVVSDILERAISAQIDNDQIDGEVESMAQDGVLAGRGLIRVRLFANDDGTKPRLGYENVSWRDYREGPAKRARDVPWRAFRHTLTAAEVERVSDDAMAELQMDKDGDPAAKEAEDIDVWEIWCRTTMKVYFVADEIGKILTILDDPLQLSGFFPCPEPVQPITATGKRTPVCPYSAYKSLNEELNKTTRRINAIMGGLKVRGVIAADAGDIERLSEVDDNTLIPIANLEGLAAVGGLQNAIVWWPVDQAIAVLQQLYIQRDTTKQLIYEVTGISDIVRGQSDPNETLGAQQIKTQWGSHRVKRLQRMVQRHIRQLFIISAEIMSGKFQPQDLAYIAGVAVQPEMQNEVFQMLSVALDHYRIDVESDSTIRADLTMRRGEMGEFLGGTANFFGVMAPVIEKTPSAAGPAAEIFSAFARQFSLGKQAEDAIDQMASMAQQQGQQPAEQADPKMQAAMAKAKTDMEIAKMRHAQKMKEMQIDLQRLQLELMKMAQDGRFKGVDQKLKAGELELKAKAEGRADDAQDFDQLAKVAEIEMEHEQKRGVLIGGQ